jgi:hypothetical protein
MDNTVYEMKKNDRLIYKAFVEDVTDFILKRVSHELIDMVNNIPFPALINNSNKDLNDELSKWDTIFQLGELSSFLLLNGYDVLVLNYREYQIDFFNSTFFSTSNRELNKPRVKNTYIHMALLAIHMLKIEI